MHRPTLSDGGQFGPTVDNNSPLLTFRCCFIKGLEGAGEGRRLATPQVRTVISGSDEEELNSQR